MTRHVFTYHQGGPDGMKRTGDGEKYIANTGRQPFLSQFLKFSAFEWLLRGKFGKYPMPLEGSLTAFRCTV